jgi:hypothetical protein
MGAITIRAREPRDREAIDEIDHRPRVVAEMIRGDTELIHEHIAEIGNIRRIHDTYRAGRAPTAMDRLVA